MKLEELNEFVEKLNVVFEKYGFKKFNEPHLQLNDKFHHLWDYYFADGENRPSVEIETQSRMVFGKTMSYKTVDDVYIRFSGIVLNFLPTGKNVANVKSSEYKLNIEKFDWVNFEKWLVFQKNQVDTYILLMKEDFITKQKKNMEKDFK